MWWAEVNSASKYMLKPLVNKVRDKHMLSYYMGWMFSGKMALPLAAFKKKWFTLHQVCALHIRVCKKMQLSIVRITENMFMSPAQKRRL